MSATPTVMNGKSYVRLRSRCSHIGDGFTLTTYTLTPAKGRAVIASFAMEQGALLYAKKNGWVVLGRSAGAAS